MVRVAIELLIALALLGANGFFVATEFAIARLRPTQVGAWLEAGRPGARSVRHAVDNIDAYLAACQLGITIASLGLGVLGEKALHHLLEPVLGDAARVGSIGIASALAFSVITLLHVVVGELAPKSVAISRTGPTALLVAPPMRAFYLLTKPLVDAFNGLGNLLLRPFGIPPAREAGHAPHSEAELRALVRESGGEGMIEVEEQRFTEAALSFDDRRVREVMTPRSDISSIDTESKPQQVVLRTLETGHTRLPVVPAGGSLEDAVGVIHAKDLLRISLDGTADPDELRAITRPLPRVHDGVILPEVLRLLRREQQHLALVEDEHATVVGLVTMEDVLEAFVGEIEDEFDPAHHEHSEREPGAPVDLAGDAPTREVERELDIELGDLHESTIGGYLVERLGRLPARGERVDCGDWSAEILAVSEGRVAAVRVARRG